MFHLFFIFTCLLLDVVAACALQVVLQHSAVGDCAVVGLDDSLKGVVPLALCVLRNGEWRRPQTRRPARHGTALAFNFCLLSFIWPTLRVPGLQKSEDEIAAELVKLVRENVGPVAAFRKVLFVRGLPKTRSGKIPRSSLSNLVNGKSYKVWHSFYTSYLTTYLQKNVALE